MKRFILTLILLALCQYCIAFNITLTGAAPNDGRDDTQFIQLAIDIVHHSGGGTVEIPFGEFSISSPIICKNYVNIIGSNFEASVIKTTGNDNAFELNASGITISNLRLIGNGNSYAIYTPENKDISENHIEKVFVTNFQNGFLLRNCLRCTVKDCRLVGVCSSAGSGIQMGHEKDKYGATGGLIQNCYVSGFNKGINIEKGGYIELIADTVEGCNYGVWTSAKTLITQLLDEENNTSVYATGDGIILISGRLEKMPVFGDDTAKSRSLIITCNSNISFGAAGDQSKIDICFAQAPGEDTALTLRRGSEFGMTEINQVYDDIFFGTRIIAGGQPSIDIGGVPGLPDRFTRFYVPIQVGDGVLVESIKSGQIDIDLPPIDANSKASIDVNLPCNVKSRITLEPPEMNGLIFCGARCDSNKVIIYLYNFSGQLIDEPEKTWKYMELDFQ